MRKKNSARWKEAEVRGGFPAQVQYLKKKKSERSFVEKKKVNSFRQHKARNGRVDSNWVSYLKGSKISKWEKLRGEARKGCFRVLLHSDGNEVPLTILEVKGFHPMDNMHAIGKNRNGKIRPYGGDVL